MSAAASILDDVRIASPCTASWDAMVGSDRVRYCQQCQKNVYNLSNMSRQEAETFIGQRAGRTCVRFYRRADGTMLTQDCPVGLRAIRRVARRSWALIAGGMATVLGVFIAVVNDSSAERRGTRSLRQIEPFASILEWIDPSPPPTPIGILPGIFMRPEVELMGDVCVEPPPATPEAKQD
ncbi:MAG: hypothetical protein K2R98_15740 [Gemmataceae bacterium]|nr:hypothetical protein [Gemmataceae bacterium]